MSEDTATILLEEVRLLRGEIDGLRADLAARKAEQLDATAPMPERPRIQPYTVAEFCKLIRRHDEWVSDRCRSGIIRSLPGKPYRIPVSELARWAEDVK